jgi:membrane-bound hydrogenase subunit mbhJ
MFYPRWFLHFWRRPAVTRFPFSSDPEAPARPAEVMETVPRFRRSLAVRHVDAGSCNGCEAELSLLGTPVYDWSRFGFGFTPSPRHADILIVTGIITDAMVPSILATWEAMPEPKRAVAVGACALDGNVFRGVPGAVGDLAQVLPVAAKIPGCPPSPNDLLAGLLAVVQSPVQARWQ